MNFRLASNSVTLNNVNGVVAPTLRYFTEFGYSVCFWSAL